MTARNGGREWELLEPLHIPCQELTAHPCHQLTGQSWEIAPVGLGFPTCKTVLKETSLPLS